MKQANKGAMVKRQFMQTLMVLVSFLALAAVAQEAAQSADSDRSVATATEDDLTVQEVLERDASQGDYVDRVSCLNARRLRDTDVLDAQHVAFKMGRDEYYLVQFKHRCLGLRKNRPVRLNMRNSRLCKYDSIQGIDPDSMVGMREGMRCSIPGFTKVSKAQVEQLKVALKDERQRAREQTKEERRKIREERRAQRRGET